MKIMLTRIITGGEKYTFRSLFYMLKQLQRMSAFLGNKIPKNINIFSLKIKQRLQSSIFKHYSISPDSNICKILYAYSIFYTHNTKYHNQTIQVAQNSQLYLVSGNKKHHELASGSTCIGWESVRRSCGAKYTKKQYGCFIIFCKNQSLLSFKAWRPIFNQNHLF